MIDVGDVPDKCRQVVVVTAGDQDSTTGQLTYYERVKPGDDNGWKKVGGPMKCALGEGGVGVADDNTGKTPEGPFPLGLSLGHYLPDHFIHLKMNYKFAGNTDWWDESVKYWTFLLENEDGLKPADTTYNQWIVSKAKPVRDPKYVAMYGRDLPDREVESLAPKDQAKSHPDDNSDYNLAVFVDHNPTRTPGKGCAIFLHCRKDLDDPTEGCVAIHEPQLKTIMEWLDLAKTPYMSVIVDDDDGS
ncbi:hypothetical protein EUA04_26520 [Mycolicibacterium obuense]|uniref:Uncharacterized protein n=1 Tax=Mycolicibacterium obuense TaxID=1807 RepID=A0A4V3AY53_9MYCO|nr:L,D-transpeptidase family protein [Mycolicibacterium obuense]TDL02982.1 hypothetical protein EUA04_26520 [Mycolicibacterium obuense]